MTEPERAALEHIRRVVDSAIGEKLAPDAPSSQAVKLLPVPYVTQRGPGADRFNNDSGAAAGVMLVRAYTGVSITVDEFFARSGQHADYPLSFTHISNVMKAIDVPVELRYNLKLSDLALSLSSGRPVILLVRQAVLQQAGLTAETYNGPHYLPAVGLDVAGVYVHDPLRDDDSGRALAVPWLILYQAWTLAQGYQRAALVPRMQLVRRVRVTAATLGVRAEPHASSAQVGTVRLDDVFELTAQKDRWGKIGEGMWISLAYVADI